jgi:Uma2 family endonuclease
MQHARPFNPAPWAEIVPNVGPMSAADLLTLPDDGYVYEVVDGALVRMAGSKPRALFVADRLYRRLGDYVEDQSLGRTTGADGVYDFSQSGQPGTGLLPDIGFIRAEVVARLDLDAVLTVAPDLAVEIASENQFRPAMGTKAQRYLAAGTRLVWIIYPRWQQVDVWHPGDTTPVTLRIGDVLDGETVVPGFTFPVARLFT